MITAKHLIFLSISLLSCKSDRHAISKRSLLFPRNGVVQFTYGLTVPLVLPRRSINFSACAQSNYNMPTNISRLQPMTIPARQDNSFFTISRMKFYEYVVEYLESFGLEGEECLLRSICEIAETPMHIKDEDTLLEKIVHFVFTPSLEIHSEIQDLTKQEDLGLMDKLLLAEKNGKTEGQCDETYSDCLVSIVDTFSTKYII